ncbi:MAG TPA: DUF4178 domain-containing protein [Arenimonas sp.]|nr:DUF4178 domain-containing protein [Arenimonas sp.]HOZ04675.1 DUF4178 domain-containing protein [Arenimonas sp.]HPO23678.1 DUF4178 domain-containing protein [Arenimonas sp.]HPW31946.1 DUF4178 domain-containing protein [Arenimonas sp.]
MARAFAALKEGDGLLISETLYRASGKITLKTPDGSMWDEWLLCPKFSITRDSLQNLSYKWLAQDEELGLTLWSPISLNTQPTFGEVQNGQSVAVNGNTYRATETDDASVILCTGDLGGECNVGDKFSYADMRAGGSHLLSIEWDKTGQEAMLGRRVPDAEVLKWAKDAGNNLLARMSTTSFKATPASSHDSRPNGKFGVSGWITMILVFAAAIFLETCDRDNDCEQRLNPNTNQYETVCDNGVRSRSGRGSTGWGGK